MFNKYKLNLMNCKNDHDNTLYLEEFHKTQIINYSKIICDDCKKYNRKESYNNAFYKCLSCNQKICPLCKQKHKGHNIISYEEINYICNNHKDTRDKYISYCKDCKVNLCIYCNHNKEHNIINLQEIIKDDKDIKKIKKEITDFKLIIEKFKNEIIEIENILKILNNVKDNSLFFK